MLCLDVMVMEPAAHELPVKQTLSEAVEALSFVGFDVARGTVP